MDGLYLISNAWGPRFGGINAFNTDFAKHLGLALGRRLKVGCIVLEADDKAIADAAEHQVDLIPIGPSPDHDRFDHARAHDILAALKARHLPTDGTCWIGHDILTGDVASRMAAVARNATVVLIHHMSYVRYQGYKHASGQDAKTKHERQRALFNAAHRVFGVGPLLRNALVDMLERPPEAIGMIVPGLPEIVARPMPAIFTATAFGRLDPENDRIKQGRLAVAGFARLCREADKPHCPKVLAQRPKMWLVGIAAAGGEEEQGLRAFACEQAGRAVDLDPLPYDNDRQRVLNDLARSSVALMLSWHEGFGLTGWEAIAAEVPLILGKNSGLHQLIDDRLQDAGLACLKVIDVRGNLPTEKAPEAENFQPEDVQAVCSALLDIAHDPDRAKRNAKRLRQMLRDEGFIWEETARRFAADLGIDLPEPDLPPDRRTEPDQPKAPAEQSGTDQAGSTGESRQPPPLLQIPRLRLREGLVQAESTLLRADAECVPFHPLREPVLAEILNWIESAATPALAMQLRVGAGGSGKTRLLIETCRRLADRGWCAGFLRSGTDFDPNEFARLLREHPRVLVVLDYAEARQTELVALLKVALKPPCEGRLRIMLLARAVGEWWDRLPVDHADLEPFLTGRAVGIPSRLHAIAPEAQQRETLFREATEAFAAVLGRSERPSPPDLSAEHFGQVLFIHLAALAALAGQRPETAAGLLDATLRREARYWYQAIAGAGLPQTARRGLEQALAMLTLTDGARTAALVRRRIERVAALRDTDQATRDAVQTLARGFYPLEGGIDALRPDILGERLVAQELARDDELLDLALGEGADAPTRTAALSVLTRLAQHSEDGDLWLRRGLERHLSACAETAVKVAVKTGDPCGRILAELLDAAPVRDRRLMCDRLVEMLPDQTVVLLEVGEVVTRRRLADLRSRIRGLPKSVKQKQQIRDLATAHAKWLGDLGRFDEALPLMREVVSVVRGLERQNDPGSRGNVAVTLNNLAALLWETGRLDEAELRAKEAMEIDRGLANHRFGGSHQSGNLAASIGNHANLLRQLGQYNEALTEAAEALEIYRLLNSGRSDSTLAKFAIGLGNFSYNLSDVGRFHEAVSHAEQALEIYRRLAVSQADAFSSQLPWSLSTLAIHFAGIGRYQDALAHAKEALAIRRRLADSRLDVFADRLASSLVSVAAVLGDLGQFDDALRYSKEAIPIYRSLAVTRADAFRGDLAQVLGNHAAINLYLGQPLPAQTFVAEALDLLSSLPGTRSASLHLDMAWALALRAWSLREQGDLDEAAAEAGRACSILDASLANHAGRLPQQAPMTYWIGSRCAGALGDSQTAQRRVDQALGVLNLWVENGTVALPAYLIPAAAELLDTDDRRPAAGERYCALKALLGRGGA